jgi:hypothetical protein
MPIPLEKPNGPPLMPETRVTRPPAETIASEVEGWERGQELNRRQAEIDRAASEGRPRRVEGRPSPDAGGYTGGDRGRE